jgi:hypothetical protein
MSEKNEQANDFIDFFLNAEATTEEIDHNLSAVNFSQL